MKMSLYVSVFCGAVFYSFSLQAACVTPPDCADLGYTSDASKCAGASLKCPWDLTKAACEEGKNCTDYTLSSCPDGAICSVCQDNASTKYKIDSCKEGFKQAGSACTKKSCSDYGYNDLIDQVCNNRHSVKLGNNSGYCYSNCKKCSDAISCITDLSYACQDLPGSCYTSVTKSVSGYSYGKCRCFKVAMCSSTTFQCTNSKAETCSGGASGSSCACGGTHDGIGYTGAHHCL